jgi:hypothetical protein
VVQKAGMELGQAAAAFALELGPAEVWRHTLITFRSKST